MELRTHEADGGGSSGVLAFGREARVSQPSGGIDAESAWQAVQARDAALDGRFVYAVRSTGVYCRPSCPSRRPRRAQVAFFGDPVAAEQGGFRACRRCRPDQDGPSDIARRVQAARAFLDAHADERVSLARLADAVQVSASHLQRAFTRLVGLSPKAYAEAARLERFQARLRQGSDVTDAAYGSGYGSGSRVYEQAAARLGMTPGRYRRGGADLTLRVATAATPLGRLLVAASERGLCAAAFGDSDEQLREELRRDYPRATLADDRDGLEPWIRAVTAAITGGPVAGSLPLDLHGSAFQWRVWRALQRIPAGETRTYAQLARDLGRPGAARAVARACATNRVAVLVPCHRVVPASGGEGGYRWGVERKARLLAGERGGRRSAG
jgi:AraC family transcriptional regulator of adaptative response/methylated-DNA-[protein]-cysteine methyltransferase